MTSVGRLLISLIHCNAGADDADFLGELSPYINGTKTAPVPTYFIGGFGLGSTKAVAALAAAAPQCNIHYLGRSGVSKINGLQVAFLDGKYNALAYNQQQEKQQDGNNVTSTTPRYYSPADVDAVKNAVSNAEGDIDFLLTNEWPAGVCAGLPEASLPSPPTTTTTTNTPTTTTTTRGTTLCAELAIAVRPRYHVASGEHIFYARLPYLNPDLGAGTLATRFLSLGAIGNASKQKWLHALGVTPASHMTPEDLASAPQGATKSPYHLTRTTGTKRAAAAAVEDATLGEQSWRWQDRAKRARAPIAAPSLGRADVAKDRSKSIFVRNVPFAATEEELIAFFSQAGTVVDLVRRTNKEGKLNTFCHVQFDSKRDMERACQLNESELQGRKLYVEPASVEEKPPRQVQPVDGCWFCLSNPNADTALVASVGEECYVALDKGAITDRHVLLLPIEHYSCSLETPASTAAEMDRYISALKSCFAAEGKEVVGFERFMRLKKSGGNHCHLNFIAVPAAAGKSARATFESIAARHGFGFTHIPACAPGQEAREALAAAVQGGEYFVGLLPDGSRLVHSIAFGERHPLSFGREVLAELAGVPHRANWKECQCSSGEEEERRTQAFRAAFKNFDIMLQD